jgi:hypothetical protein
MIACNIDYLHIIVADSKLERFDIVMNQDKIETHTVSGTQHRIPASS